MKKLMVAIGVLAFFSVVGGCSKVKDVCDRLDECNYLTGSVDDCVDDLENCYDGMSDNDQKDWDDLVKDCLDFSGCDLFLSCYALVPGC